MKTKTKFKQTEIGMIPDDWELVELLELLSGKTRNGIYKQKQFHGEGVKIINMKELFAYSRIGNQDMKRVRLDHSEMSRFLVHKGDLLFARRSLVAEGSGKCALIVEHSEPMTFESSIILARPDMKSVDSEFLYYFFSSLKGRQIMGTILRQVAVSGITGTDLMKLKIIKPPITDQQYITKILSDLDSKIELNQQMNKTLEAIGKTIFKHWFNNFEFPNKEGKPYKSSGGEMVYNDELGNEIPIGWKVEELGKFVEFVKGKKPLETSEVFTEGYLPQILIENLNGKNPVYANPDKTIVVKETEPIMVMDGASSGRIEIGYNGILGSTLAKINIKSKLLNNSYVFCYLKNKQEDINQNTTGTSIPHTDKEKIKRLLIVLPNEVLLENFNKTFTEILYKTISNKREITILTTVRDSLLPKLMSGKIRVPVGAR